jgi:hypothetical protein
MRELYLAIHQWLGMSSILNELITVKFCAEKSQWKQNGDNSWKCFTQLHQQFCRLKSILYSPNRKAVLALCYWMYLYTVNKLCIPFCAMDKYEYEKILIPWVVMSCCIVNSSDVLKHCIVFIRVKLSWADFTNRCNVTSRKTRTLEYPAASVWEHQSSNVCESLGCDRTDS